MSHDLPIENEEASMFYVGTVPWHGLGLGWTLLRAMPRRRSGRPTLIGRWGSSRCMPGTAGIPCSLRTEVPSFDSTNGIRPRPSFLASSVPTTPCCKTVRLSSSSTPFWRMAGSSSIPRCDRRRPPCVGAGPGGVKYQDIGKGLWRTAFTAAGLLKISGVDRQTRAMPAFAKAPARHFCFGSRNKSGARSRGRTRFPS